MINYIKKVVSGDNLSEEESFECMEKIISGEFSDLHIGAFLTALATKGETTEEITGFARAMRQVCVPVNISADLNLVDACGTGGDALKTFNVSTAASIIASSAGVNVAKHGNRAITSSCGGADILEYAGVKIDNDSNNVSRCLKEIGIGFMFAPNFHRAIHNVMRVRKALGIRTVFNILGPLTSPVGAKIQLLGVFDPKYVNIMAKVLMNLGVERAMVVHGFDEEGNPGMDEISNVGTTLVAFVEKGNVKIARLNPEDFGIKKTKSEFIKSPDTIEESYDILMKVLNGKNESNLEKARLDIALANAGAIIYLAGKSKTISQGTKIAYNAVKSGKPQEKLIEFIEISN